MRCKVSIVCSYVYRSSSHRGVCEFYSSLIFLQASESYMTEIVYIQSVDASDRYLSEDGSNGHIYLLPFSSNTTAFLVRPCFWQLLKQTYPNLTCISLKSENGQPGRYLQHGNYRMFLALSNMDSSSNFVGDASFLLVGDPTNFRLRSTASMRVSSVIWLQYEQPNYEIYMRATPEIVNIHRFKFVVR